MTRRDFASCIGLAAVSLGGAGCASTPCCRIGGSIHVHSDELCSRLKELQVRIPVLMECLAEAVPGISIVAINPS